MQLRDAKGLTNPWENGAPDSRWITIPTCLLSLQWISYKKWMEQIVYETNCHWSIFSMLLLVRGHDFQVCWSTNPVPSCQQPWPQNEQICHRPGVLLVCLFVAGKGISEYPCFHISNKTGWKENFVGNPYDYRGYNMVSCHITRENNALTGACMVQ